MNAHTTIRVDEPVREKAYRLSIAVHNPTTDEMQMAARVDLASLRDAAAFAAARATDSASVVLNEVTKLATSAVFSSLPTSRLIRVRAALDLTMEAARALDRIERDG